MRYVLSFRSARCLPDKTFHVLRFGVLCSDPRALPPASEPQKELQSPPESSKDSAILPRSEGSSVKGLTRPLVKIVNWTWTP